MRTYDIIMDDGSAVPSELDLDSNGRLRVTVGTTPITYAFSIRVTASPYTYTLSGLTYTIAVGNSFSLASSCGSYYIPEQG